MGACLCTQLSISMRNSGSRGFGESGVLGREGDRPEGVGIWAVGAPCGEDGGAERADDDEDEGDGECLPPADAVPQPTQSDLADHRSDEARRRERGGGPPRDGVLQPDELDDVPDVADVVRGRDVPGRGDDNGLVVVGNRAHPGHQVIDCAASSPSSSR
jgi:hypothetical protein